MNYILAFILLVISTLPVQARTVHFVLSKDNTVYQQAYEKIHFQLELGTDNEQKKQLIDNFTANSVAPDDLIITVGTKAAKQIQQLGLKNPVIFSFVYSSLFEQADMNKAHNHWAAVALNQPTKNLIKAADQLIQDSYKNKILVVVSSDNQTLLREIASIGPLQNSSLDIVVISQQQLAAKEIEQHLFEAGALVTIHDKNIWSGNSAKLLLQQAFTHKIPVIGYSKNFLTAGAVISVYTPIEEVTRECIVLINQWLKTNKLDRNGVIYPPAKIEANSNIARALRIPTSKINSMSVDE
jgi:ABC-type uncharacterized transport system substrate-binding protein